jgi:hypothetical protein
MPAGYYEMSTSFRVKTSKCAALPPIPALVPPLRSLATSYYLVAVLLKFGSAFQGPLLANAESFETAGTLKLGSNKVSIPGPFASGPKFIHGIVSR